MFLCGSLYPVIKKNHSTIQEKLRLLPCVDLASVDYVMHRYVESDNMDKKLFHCLRRRGGIPVFKKLFAFISAMCIFLMYGSLAWGSAGTFACDTLTSAGSWVLTSSTKADCEGTTCRDHWAMDTVDKVYYACSSGYLYCQSQTSSTKISTVYGYSVVPGTYWGVYHSHSGATGDKAPVCNCSDGSTPPLSKENKILIAYSNDINQYRCSCNLSVQSFIADKVEFYPGRGQKVAFTGSVVETYGNPIDWTVEIAGKSFQGTGPVVSVTWDGLGTDNQMVAPGTYTAKLSSTVPNSGCTDTKSVQVAVKYDCDVKIQNAMAVPSVIDPYAGGNATFNASVTTVLPYTLTVAVDGKTLSGSAWDGTDNSGNIAKPGTHSATITATVAGVCSKSETAQVKVIEGPKMCPLSVKSGSTTNVSTGEMSHGQELFAVKGTSFMMSSSLAYRSLDGSSGPLGIAWHHNYEADLSQDGDGSLVVRIGERQRVYSLNAASGKYDSQSGDSSLLTSDTDKWVITETDGTKYTFSLAGRLISITDRFGNIIAFAYDAVSGDLAAVNDNVGRSIIYGYDTSVTPHRLTTIKDPNGNVYTFDYDGSGRLHRVVYPVTDESVAAGYWEYTYKDATTLLETRRDPGNNLTRYTYQNGKMISAIDPEGVIDPTNHTRVFAYPAATGTVRSTTFTDKDGGQWLYSYDVSTGVLKDKALILDATHLGPKTSYYYDFPAKTQRAKTEPSGDGKLLTTFYTYDNHGNILTQTDPVDLSIYKNPAVDPQTVDVASLASLTPPVKTAVSYSYDYANNDQLKSVTDERNVDHFLTTGYVYSTDSEGFKVTTVTDPTLASTITRQYPDGRTKDVTDANGKKTSFTYRADRLLESVTDPAGVVTFYSSYDNNGNSTEQKVMDADGVVRKTISMVYDARNRLRKSTTRATGQPDIVTSYDYDGNDNMNHVKDAELHDTWYEYNYDHQVTKVTDNNGNVTKYLYGGGTGNSCSSCGGGVDKLVEVRDGNQSADPAKPGTSYRYDLQGRLTYETDPLLKKYHYTYYDNGKLKEKYDATDLQNEVLLVTYSYDNEGRLLNKHYGGGAPTFAPPDEGYTYDTNGRMATAYNANVTYTYAYYPDGSNTGRLKSITDNSGRQVYYDDYDGLGQKKRVVVLKGTAGERAIGYEYDKNRPWKITSNAGTFIYSYDKLSRRQNLTYPHGVTATYSYDNLDRLTGISHTAGAATVSFSNYTSYDKVGNRKNKVTARGVENYAYDPVYRLQQSVSPKGGENFTYDAVGNRKTGPGAKDNGYQYNNGNQMTYGRLLSYLYDNAGNQSTRTAPNVTNKTWIQTWDVENRLTKVEMTKGVEKRTVDFKYDPLGRRIEKKLTTTLDGTPATTKISTRTYIYDENDVAVEIYKSPLGDPESTYYTHGAGVDEHLALERGGQFYYYHADGLGSIVAITNGNKGTVQSYEYDSFGMVQPTTDFRNSYTYTGREWDKETGLYFLRGRYYDPMEGRFISKDPIGFDGGDVNLYGYVGNNPINFTDPTGLTKSDPWYGYNNKDFQRWFHRCWKQKGGPRVTPEEDIAEAYDEWVSRGAPTDGRCWGKPKECDDKKHCTKQTKMVAVTLATGYVVYKLVEFFVCPPLVITTP